VDAVAAIGDAGPAGVGALMRSLVESGLCMALAGHSRPASGAEHHFSHFWEMRLLSEGRAPILHGMKVGVGTLEAARLWERVRSLDEGAAEAAIEAQGRFLGLGEAGYRGLGRRVLGSWDAILRIAAGVPGVAETKRLLAAAGCPTSARELGLGRRDAELGRRFAHYARDRFTVKRLALLLGLD
jgi:glycerol-1-phosphate dehydrogenase [NAD(P)+]